METIEKVGNLTDQAQNQQTAPQTSSSVPVVHTAVHNQPNPNFEISVNSAPMSSGAPNGGDETQGRDSADTRAPVINAQAGLPAPQGQGSQPKLTDLGHSTAGTTEGSSSRQIPPIHEIPSMSGGASSIGNGNLLSGHGNSGNSSAAPQFTSFNGVSSGPPLPRAPSLQDVTSGSHPELLRRSSSNISDAGVGIPRQLVDVTQSSNMLLSQSGNHPVLQSSTSGGVNSGDSNVPVLNGATRSASGSIPYGNMLTSHMQPLNQMTMAIPGQGSHGQGNTNMTHQPHSQQQQPPQQSSQQNTQQQQQQLAQQQLAHQQRANQQQQQYAQQQKSSNNGSNNGGSTANSTKKTGRWSGQPMAARPWHTAEHAPQRSEMNRRIVTLLQQRRPDATQEWSQKLPQMAKRLEEALYSEAQTFEMYYNFNTLKNRLQQLALSMSGKVSAKNAAANSAGAGGTSGGQSQGQSHGQTHEMTQDNLQLLKHQQLFKQQQQQRHRAHLQQMQQGANNNYQQQQQGYSNSGHSNQRPQQAGGGQQHPNYQMNNYHQQNGGQPMTIATENSGGLLPHNMQQSNSAGAPGVAGSSSRFVNMNNLNPTLYSNANAAPTAPPATKATAKETKAKKEAKSKAATKAAPISAIAKAAASKQASVEGIAPGKGKKRGASGGDDDPPTKVAKTKTKKPTKKELAEEQKRIAMLEKANNTALANAKSKGVAKGQGNQGAASAEDHRRAVLKQQIQRLLLLRHASKCPHEANQCPVTTHCSSMKTLWKHLMKCKDQECKVPHCVSSRYVLSHYSKCQDSQCPVCGPVRASIRKASNENNEIVQSLNKKSAPAPNNKKPIPEEPKAPPGPQPPDTLSSAIYNFTDDQIRYHVSHLHDGLRMKASDVRSHCVPLVDEMIRHANGYIFSSPVDPVKLSIPDYPEIIKRPMDLGTVRKRLETGYYRNLEECANDVRLTFDNAMLYNPTTTEVFKCARYFKSQFEKKLKDKLQQIENATEERRRDPNSCRLCGEKDSFFEIPNYYCNGKCASRIKRNSVYYSDEKNTLHWCQSCYNELRDPIKVVGSPNIFKKDLKKGRLQGETEDLREPMVCCDGCERWIHYVCGLFNGRRNLSKEMQYFCPQCVLQQRAKKPAKTIVPDKKMLASTLPHCLLSEYIEKRVATALENSYKENAEKLGVPVESVEKAPPLYIRQVSCIDNAQPTQEGMRTRYAYKNYPVEFPCRAKCILMFQHMDGQDVILFGMYVYEYGHKCPQPNQRRVYISYLDSVHYLRPRQYRTPVYHEILIAYLDYVKMRGFHTAHIWACPPMPKDDYIFNIHPPDQKTPKQERLRQWYVSMLDKCIERGIVQEVKDLHTEFMLDDSNDATVLPYLDGDYWVGVAEDIIKKLGKDGQYIEDDANVANDSKSKRKKDKNAVGPPKRSRGRQPRSTSSSSIAVPTGRDPVMVKLSATIEPMKHDFFVARLHSKEYIEACAKMAEMELTDEAGKAGEKEKDDKKLQEEALSSGDSGKSGKMKKIVSQKREPNYSIGPPESTKEQEVSAEKEIPPVGSKDLENSTQPSANTGASESIQDQEVKVAPVEVASTIVATTASTSISSDTKVENVADSNEGEKMEVEVESVPEQNTTEQSGDNKTDQTENSEESSAMEVEQPVVKSENEEGEGSGLLASVSKLASSFFGNNSGNGDGPSGDAPAVSNDDSTPKMEVDDNEVKPDSDNVREQNACDEKESSELKADEGSKMEIDETVHETNVIKTEAAKGPDAPVISAASSDVTVKTEGDVKVESSVGDDGSSSVKMEEAGSESTALVVKEEEKVVDNTPTRDTEDRDDTQECEHFETRLAFLQLCQGNHYQFDQLRRAKHTSMMVLYHLHNPDAPKFMAVCNVPTCNQSIVTGTRFHCEACDVDFCQSCYVAMCTDPKTRHIHPLRQMAVSGSSSLQPLTEEQRRERNRSIQLHLQLLLHSARDCIGKKCNSKNCEKMKEFLKHEPSCKVGFKKGCPTCKKVLNLLNLHARSCRVDDCPVPRCVQIKDKIKQNLLKQRQMDDRRRQMMNDMYSRGGS